MLQSEIIKHHLVDLSKLHCFINANNVENIKFYPIENNTRMAFWLKKNDFSDASFCLHLIRFYELDLEDYNSIINICRGKTLLDLSKYISYKIGNSSLLLDSKIYTSSDYWQKFIDILSAEGVQVVNIKSSDQISQLLNRHLKEVIYAMSKMSPGSIKDIKILKNKNLTIINRIIFICFLLIIFNYFFEFDFSNLFGFLIIILSVIVKYSIQIKQPEMIQINDFITFNDFLDFLTKNCNKVSFPQN